MAVVKVPRTIPAKVHLLKTRFSSSALARLGGMARVGTACSVLSLPTSTREDNVLFPSRCGVTPSVVGKLLMLEIKLTETVSHDSPDRTNAAAEAVVVGGTNVRVNKTAEYDIDRVSYVNITSTSVDSELERRTGSKNSVSQQSYFVKQLSKSVY